MTVIHKNSSAVSPEGSQHPTTSVHPSSSIIIRRMRSRNPTVHNRYFIPDGNLDLELEDGTVYRVHRHFFTQYSENFASEYLSGPASSSFVRLKGAEAQDLDCFLSLIYPSRLGQLDISTADEWTGVLRLADRWSFLDLRKLALEKLDALSSPAKCGVIVSNAIIPLNDRTEVACDLGGTAWSTADQDDVPLLHLPTTQRIPLSEAMACIVAGPQEPSEGLDVVDAVDILQSVRESMRAMLHSVTEEASMNGEHASLDVEDGSLAVEDVASNGEDVAPNIEGVASDLEEASLTVLNDASLDVKQASLNVEGAPLHAERAPLHVEYGSSAVESVPASPGADPTTEAAHKPVAPHIASDPVAPHIAPDPVAPHIALEPLNISHEPSSVTYESLSATYEPLNISRESLRITREPLSTTDLLRELPFDFSTPPNNSEPSLSNSEASARPREPIQDRLQRVVGKEPLKRPPSLWSSFRRGFVTHDYNSALLRNDYDGASFTNGYNGASLMNGYDGASSMSGYDGASFTNGYDGTSSTTGYDGASSTRGHNGASLMDVSPRPDAPSSKDCSSSKEDHEQAQVSSAREPEGQVARSGEERLARSGVDRMARSDEECVIGSGEDIPALGYEDRARDDEEDRVRRRQERMARYREEFNADLRAQVERTRESMNRARETASRWMDIFGRTTYSSAFYE